MMRQRGEKYVEAALVIGGPPVLTYLSGSRTPYGVEEYAVAGALIGEPLELVKCKTVDLHVPAHAELVIEGRISTEYLEPEAPFGEFTGYMGERVYNAVFETTAITHRKNPIFTAILSQMPPSESSDAEEDGAGQQLPLFPAQSLRPARRGRHLASTRSRWKAGRWCSSSAAIRRWSGRRSMPSPAATPPPANTSSRSTRTSTSTTWNR